MKFVTLATLLCSSAVTWGAQQMEVGLAPVKSPDLWTSAKAGDPDAIVQQLADGAEIDALDDNGVTPLSWAAMLGHANCVDLLIEKGANVDARNGDESTALIAASFFGRTDVARLLIEHGANLDAENHEGHSALDVTNADWKDIERIASDLQIEVNREQVEAGREQVAAILQQKGAAESRGPLFVFAIVFGSIAFGMSIVGVVIWLVHRHEKKRIEELKAIAEDIGLEFLPTKDCELLAKLQAFSLFSKGHSRKMKNVMKAEAEIANLTVFDYHYNTGGGKHSRTHHHTVVSMESDTLELPYFSLRPEGFFSKIGAAVGFQDVDFDDHPEFSDSFVLKGENEEAIRSFFDKEMFDLFTERQGCCVESAPGVFIYLRGGRKKPEQIGEFMKEGYAVYAAFVERLSRVS